MPTQSIVLLTNESTESVNSVTFSYTDKQKGDGYYNLGDGLHTVTYLTDSFEGTIKMQGTLATNPTEDDWFDIDNTDFGADSTTAGSAYRNFTGNFVWIRAAYNIVDGTISEIRYNH
jgi:hypothetical protein